MSGVLNVVEKAIAVSNMDADTCVSNFVWHPECAYTPHGQVHELSYAIQLQDDARGNDSETAAAATDTPVEQLQKKPQRLTVNTNGGRYLLPVSPANTSGWGALDRSYGILYSDGEYVSTVPGEQVAEVVANDKVKVTVGARQERHERHKSH